MNSLWLLTKKNLTLLLRAKSSSLVVFLGPLLVILILGLAYNTSSQYGLNIGVHAPSYTDDVNAFITVLQEQEFRIIKYDSVAACVEDIKVGAVHTCIDLPESLKVESNTPKEVTFYIDPSKINLVWMIQETVKSKFNFKAQQISLELTQQLVEKVNQAKTSITQEKGILTGAKEKSSIASSSTESVRSSLTGLDLTAPQINYDFTVVDIIKANLTTALSDGVTAVSDAQDAVSGTNMSSSDKSTVNRALDDTQHKLSTALALVNGPDVPNFGVIATLVSSLQVDIEGARTKLTAAGDAVAASANNLNTAASSLAESLNGLNSLEASLNELSTSLDSLRVTEPETIISPLTTKIEKVSKESTYLSYSFPALLVVVVMFTSLLLGTILVMMEKNSPAFLRNYFLPVRKTTFILSIYLTTLAMILVQIAIILGIALLFLNETTLGILPVALILFVAASVFTFLGMAIGYLFTSEDTGVLASISVGSLLLFLSGVVLPIETISPQLRAITSFNPFVIAEKMIREVFIFNSSIFQIGIDFAILLAYAIVLFLVILIIESAIHHILAHKLMKHQHSAHHQQDLQKKNEV